MGDLMRCLLPEIRRQIYASLVSVVGAPEQSQRFPISFSGDFIHYKPISERHRSNERACGTLAALMQTSRVIREEVSEYLKCSTLVFHHLHDAQFVLCNLQPDLIHHFGILRFDFSVRDCHLLLRQGLSTFFHHNDEPYPTPAQAWHQAWHRVQGLPLLRRIELVLPAGLTTSIPNGEALHNNMIAAAAQLTRQPEEGPFMEQARMTDMVMRILSGLNMERVEHEMSFYEPLPRYFESVDDVLAEYMGGSYLDVD